MIITKEQKELMVDSYREKGYDEYECIAFTDGLNKMIEFVGKQLNK